MKKEKGAVIILYVTIVSVVAFLLLLVSQSRLMLAIRRNQSTLDALNTTNQAESEINDLLARIVGGYIDESNFPISNNFDVGDIKVEVEGTQLDDTQTITVKTNRGFATSQIQAVREIRSIDNADKIEIILALDCTASMDKGADCTDCDSTPTRMDALKEATINFVDSLATDKNSDKFEVGVMVFGIDTKWMKYQGLEIKPGSLSFAQIKQAVDDGIGSTRAQSPSCLTVMDATSVGSAYSKMDDYFSVITNPRIKKVAIAVTDGLPNSTIKDNDCSVEFCPAYPRSSDGQNYCETNEYGWSCYEYNQYEDGPWGEDNFNQIAYDICEPLSRQYLNCALADTETFIGGPTEHGTRDVNTDAYAVTIYTNAPLEVTKALQDYTVAGGYFNAPRASQLSDMLDALYKTIVKDRSIIRVKRVVS